MQSDGNFVIYCSSGVATWSSDTAGTTGTYVLSMQTDGNLVIYKSGTATWSSNTAGKGSAPYSLILADEGNLIMYSSTGSVIWQTYSSGYCSSPIKMCVEAADLSNSGTSDDVTLDFIRSDSRYKCTLYGGVGRGVKKCCQGAKYSTATSSKYDHMNIKVSNDGLRVAQIYCNGVTAGRFEQMYVDDGPEMDGDYGAQNELWKRFWVDNDDHENCGTVAVQIDYNNDNWQYVYCDE
jgi:hypothetical protein